MKQEARSRKHELSVAICIDLGGTDLKSAVVDSSGKILHQQSTPSESKKNKKKILDNLISSISIEEQWAQAQGFRIQGVGLGIPGIVSYPEGIVHRSPHFPDLKDFPIKKLLQKKIHFPLVLDNDANMAALGEGWIGAAKGKKNYLLMTLGTGIGGGIVFDGKLLHGDSGFAGEVGHIVIEREGRRCNCGGRGCLEMYASATGILYGLSPSLRRRGLGGGLTAEHLYHLALQGNKTAQKIYKDFGKALGAGIASLVNVLDIELVMLGGGLSGAWKVFIDSTRQSIARHTYLTTAKKIILKRALLGNNAGLIGTARAVFVGY
jgi:glucokinase